jgi:hypothetical protein
MTRADARLGLNSRPGFTRQAWVHKGLAQIQSMEVNAWRITSVNTLLSSVVASRD